MSRQKRIRMQFRAAQQMLRQCIGKIRHRSELKAIRTAKRVWLQNNDTIMEPYLCPHCNGWHIGHRK